MYDVSQVMTSKEEDIEKPPDIIRGIDSQYINMIGKVNEKIIILLDLYEVLSTSEEELLADIIS